jgi:hypothetical protein
MMGFLKNFWKNFWDWIISASYMLFQKLEKRDHARFFMSDLHMPQIPHPPQGGYRWIPCPTPPVHIMSLTKHFIHINQDAYIKKMQIIKKNLCM